MLSSMFLNFKLSLRLSTKLEIDETEYFTDISSLSMSQK